MFAFASGERACSAWTGTYSESAGLGDWDNEVSRRDLEPIEGNRLEGHRDGGVVMLCMRNVE